MKNNVTAIFFFKVTVYLKYAMSQIFNMFKKNYIIKT